MVRIISTVYEMVDGEPVLTLSHVFYGPTLKRALHIEQAHMKSDAFFKAAMTAGSYEGIILEVDRSIERD